MAYDQISSFRNWATHAKPGQMFRYYEGYLPRDREFEPEVHVLAVAVWLSYLKGSMLLLQRRIGDMHYEYLAVKRDRIVPIKWIGGRYTW